MRQGGRMWIEADTISLESGSLREKRGVYVLVVEVQRDISRSVGALGRIDFPRGLYAYIGSARGGIGSRVARHLKKRKKRTHWHIDYLLEGADVGVRKVIFKETLGNAECATARTISKSGHPTPGFGCSDCSCLSHLYRLRDEVATDIIEKWTSPTLARG